MYWYVKLSIPEVVSAHLVHNVVEFVMSDGTVLITHVQPPTPCTIDSVPFTVHLSHNEWTGRDR